MNILPVEVIDIILLYVENDLELIYWLALVVSDPMVRSVIVNRRYIVHVAVPELDPRNRQAVSIRQCQEFLEVFNHVHLVPWIHNVYLTFNQSIVVPLFVELIVKRFGNHIDTIDWPFSCKELPTSLVPKVALMRFSDYTLLGVVDERYVKLERVELQLITYPVVRLRKPRDTVKSLTISGNGCEIETLPSTLERLTITGHIYVTCPVPQLTHLRVDLGVRWKYPPRFPRLIELRGTKGADLQPIIALNPQLESIEGSDGVLDYCLPQLQRVESTHSLFAYTGAIGQQLVLRNSIVTAPIDCPQIDFEVVTFKFTHLSHDLTHLKLKDVDCSSLQLDKLKSLVSLELKSLKLNDALIIDSPQLQEVALWWVELPRIEILSSIHALDLVCVDTIKPMDYPTSLRHFSITDDKIANIILAAPLERCLVMSNSLQNLTILNPHSLTYLKCHIPQNTLRLGDFTSQEYGTELWEWILITPYFAKLVMHQLPLPVSITLLRLKNNQTMDVVPRLLRSLSIEGGKLPVNLSELVHLRELELDDISYDRFPVFPSKLQLLKINRCRCTRWRWFRELELRFNGLYTEIEQLSIMLNQTWSWDSIEGPKHRRLKILNVRCKPREGWPGLERALPDGMVALCHGLFFKGLIVWDNICMPELPLRYLLQLAKAPYLLPVRDDDERDIEF